MDLLSYISSFKEYYNKWIEEARAQIVQDESLYVTHSHNSVQFYRRTQKEPKGRFIRKSKISEEVPRLAQSMYAKALLKLLLKSKKRIDAIEETVISLSGAWRKLPDVLKQFVRPIVLSNTDYRAWWEAQPYIPNDFPHKEHHFTERGEDVRSKSEEMIANALLHADIPYKYEAPVFFNDKERVYPDFTILLVKRQKEIIFEHFGKLKEPGYLADAMVKIKRYQENGYFLGVNLLVTLEFENDDLDSKSIAKLIGIIKNM